LETTINMSKKIKLTETQLKKVVNIISESSFDDMITKYNDTKQREVGMSHDDAIMLVNIATNWCQGKDNLPDCQDIQTIKSKLNLY
jgi:hypothetical protein